ncbi:hypothetical protein KDI_28940 [Dictyobacter arantiisoli]|uniref:Uncharacterized protein n=1 Tax=Dictyobacter arantiisoli TaxID=2014874 RepID=A0A5A5TCT1_9CHLR|nr:hypothetical protein KDI_28940 [Dictyobacter arantiisoli]
MYKNSYQVISHDAYPVSLLISLCMVTVSNDFKVYGCVGVLPACKQQGSDVGRISRCWHV